MSATYSLQRREVAVEPDEFYTLIGVYSFGKGIFHDPKPGSELGDYRFLSVVPGDLVLSNIQAWERRDCLRHRLIAVRSARTGS